MPNALATMTGVVAPGGNALASMTKPADFMFRPFEPGERRENKDGSHSTELSRGVTINGEIANVPSLWKNSDSGKTVDLATMSDDKIGAFVAKYEAATGQKFPRFSSWAAANSAAAKRSEEGGADAPGARFMAE